MKFLRSEGLFQPLADESMEFLATYGKAVDAIAPIKAKHRATLHRDVRDLSRLLTAERSKLRVDYLQNPARQSAYLRYFLPMNLIRLATLLQGLAREGAPLGFVSDLADGDIVWDLGSGPLTMVQALWLARPDLRERKLTFLCMDVSRKTMGLGRDILNRLTDGKGWTVRLVQGRMPQDLRRLEGTPKLITMANLLNELDWPGRGSLEYPMAELVQAIPHLHENPPAILAVEPGTRLGGKLVSTFREQLMAHSRLRPMSPCPHASVCPCLDPRANTWCHFTFEAKLPEQLDQLAQKASLVKESLSLSFCLLGQGKEEGLEEGKVRILSDPFIIPGPDDRPAKVAYGCAPDGLVVCADRRGRTPPDQGALREFSVPESGRKDAKSGRPIVLV